MRNFYPMRCQGILIQLMIDNTSKIIKRYKQWDKDFYVENHHTNCGGKKKS